MKRNHDLVLEGRRLIAETIALPLPAPDEMVGSMAAVVLPDARGPDPGGDLSPMMDGLFDAGLSAIVMNWPSWPRQLLRISAHLHNTLEDYSALAEIAFLSRPYRPGSETGRWGEERLCLVGGEALRSVEPRTVDCCGDPCGGIGQFDGGIASTDHVHSGLDQGPEWVDPAHSVLAEPLSQPIAF